MLVGQSGSGLSIKFRLGFHHGALGGFISLGHKVELTTGNNNKTMSYLNSLNDNEFKVIKDLLSELGFKGLLSITWELAEFRRLQGDLSKEQRRCERISRQLGALIKTMDHTERETN